jgi:hypothetical protein
MWNSTKGFPRLKARFWVEYGLVSRLVTITGLVVLLHQSSISTASAGVAVSIGQNFTGTTSTPADWGSPFPGGAAGSDDFVEFNSDTFAVYGKADGSVLQSMTFQQFWTSAGVPLPNNPGTFIPRIIYDPTVQRWFAAAVAGDRSASVLMARLRVAVSSGADPTGSWYGMTLPDYPGGINHLSMVNLGVDAENVYFSSEVWSTNSNEYAQLSTALLALPKVDLLASPPVTTNGTWLPNLTTSTYGYSLGPAICFDGTAAEVALATASAGVDPNTGQPETNSNLIVTSILRSNDSSAITLGAPKIVRVLPYTEPINYALQPDGPTNLVDGDATITANIYCIGGVLFAAHSLQYGPHIALRWYRIRAADNTLLESGTISDPDLDLYFPSIAANSNGTVVIACNGSGLNQYVSCYALVGQTVNGVTIFGDRLLLQAGVASYQNADPSGYFDWGTSSTTWLDPADPNVFWTLNAFASGPTTWSTQITQLLTSPSPNLAIANTGTNLLLSWPVTAVPFQLQSSQDPGASASWSPVAPAGTTNGATVSATVPISGPTTFFRLIAAP